MIYDFFSQTYAYIQACIDNLKTRPPLVLFLLFAPALFFDTVRYYVTNTIVFFLNIFKENRPEQEPLAAYSPVVTALVPVFNEGERIKHTLDALLESDYPNLEIIVIDDNSQDETSRICKAYQDKGLITYLRKDQWAGKPSSLNYGRWYARGEIIVHLDGDIVLTRNAITEVIKPFRDPKVGVVSGNLRVYNDRESLVSRLQAAEYGVCISIGRRWQAMTDTLQIASGGFSCFRKEILTDLKGTDQDIGEDLDITIKARKLGFKVAFTPKAIAMTFVPSTWGSLFQQRIRWDRCYVRLNLRKHRNMLDIHAFRWGDFSAGLQDILFNVILLFAFPIYMILVLIFAPYLFPFIFIVTYLYYAIMDLGQIIIVTLLSDSPGRDAVFILYAPLFFLYSLFLRATRMLAYFLETIRSDYLKDGYFPKEIWENMPKW